VACRARMPLQMKNSVRKIDCPFGRVFSAIFVFYSPVPLCSAAMQCRNAGPRPLFLAGIRGAFSFSFIIYQYNVLFLQSLPTPLIQVTLCDRVEFEPCIESSKSKTIWLDIFGVRGKQKDCIREAAARPRTGPRPRISSPCSFCFKKST